MASKNINTEASLRQSAKPYEEIQRELKKAGERMKSDMVAIKIPDTYRAAFGDPMMFSVNGVRVEIPIGEKVEVPAPHAKHAERLLSGAVLTKNQERANPEDIYKD